MRGVDVFIAGAGPAGVATALSLRAHAPRLSVVLADASDGTGLRFGEHLPAAASALLDHLGVREAFVRERFHDAPSTVSIWGSPAPREEHTIFAARGPGWHIDRTRFDALLAHSAVQAGAELMRPVRPRSLVRDAGTWAIELSDGTRLRARFVVDATGRRASVARRLGARRVSFDRLIGYGRIVPAPTSSERGTIVESFADGWWYTTLADRWRTVVCMTDADVARTLDLSRDERWLEQLAATRRIAQVVGPDPALGDSIVRVAGSSRLQPAFGPDWLAVGDAASSFDPLSSQGVLKALRSGVFGGYAIADRLVRSDARGLAKLDALLEAELTVFREAHARFLAEERRWPTRPFWARRRRAAEVGAR